MSKASLEAMRSIARDASAMRLGDRLPKERHAPDLTIVISPGGGPDDEQAEPTPDDELMDGDDAAP